MYFLAILNYCNLLENLWDSSLQNQLFPNDSLISEGGLIQLMDKITKHFVHPFCLPPAPHLQC